MSSPVFFIGLAPGRNGADVTGVPFTRDPSGLLFRHMLERAGLIDAFVTNLVKCCPRDEKGRNRAPTRDQVRACRPHLDAELAAVKPRVVVLLGDIVTKEFLPKSGPMLEEHARPQLVDGIVYVPFIHPAYVVRGAYPRDQYAADFVSLARFIGAAVAAA